MEESKRLSELEEAEMVDRLITARQQQMNSDQTAPLALDHTLRADSVEHEQAMIDALLTLAATTAPNPVFVDNLERRLRRQYPPAAAVSSRARWWASMSRKFMVPNGPVARRMVAVGIALLLLVMSLLTTPTARATLWDWLYGFGLLHENAISGRSLPLARPTLLPETPASLSLATVQAEAPFAFQPPRYLPIGLRFTGGFVDKTTDGLQVTLAYHLTEPPAAGYAPDVPLLFIVISEGSLPNRPLIAEGEQRPVPIGTELGFYSHGNWNSTEPITQSSEATGPLFWDSTLDAAWLTWQAHKLNYLLYAQGLGLDAEQMVQIALSMQVVQ
ncbi:MAG: hypothetical protein R3C14_04840 [Caldilineaceae bacterium]